MIFRLMAYPVVLLASLLLAPALKSLVTGSAGPNTHFVSTVVLAPVAFLLLGAWQGRRVFLIHAGLIALFGAWVGITYPARPAMNFERQIVAQFQDGLVVVYALGLVSSLICCRAFGQRAAFRRR